MNTRLTRLCRALVAAINAPPGVERLADAEAGFDEAIAITERTLERLHDLLTRPAQG